MFRQKQPNEIAIPRRMLTDEQWSKIQAIMLKDRVYNKPEHRDTLEGILYRMRTGCPWRDLPAAFGEWSTVYRRFNLWSKKGVLFRLFNALLDAPDEEWGFIDGSIVKTHQHGMGAASKAHEGIGKSRGGNTTKIHLVVDSGGLPRYFAITGGEVHDSQVAPELIDQLANTDYVIADKGYDSEPLRQQIRDNKSKPVIPRKQNSRTGNDDMDWYLYKLRHLVENTFARLKHYRAIATRYDKLLRNYASTVALACCIIWLPM